LEPARCAHIDDISEDLKQRLTLEEVSSCKLPPFR